MPRLVSPLFVGVKFGADGVHAALSIAAKTTDERIFVESIDCRSIRVGHDWILSFLQEADVVRVVVDGANGQDLLATEMRSARMRPPLLPKVREIIMANAQWEQGIYQKSICHRGQPSLSQVVSNCEKRSIGSNGGFGYRAQFDDMDIALMDSALLAHWICNEKNRLKR